MSQRKHPARLNGLFSKKRLAPLVFFLIFPLVGIILLVRDLYLESRESFYLSVAKGALPVGSRTLSTQKIKPSTEDPLFILKQKRKNLLFWGALLFLFFGFSSLSALYSSKHISPDPLLLLIDVVSAAGGLFLLYLSLGLNKKISLFQTYLKAIGNHPTISVSKLSATVGHTPQQAEHTLLAMLNEGCFPHGLLHLSSGTWILP